MRPVERIIVLLKTEEVRALVRESWAVSWPITVIMFFEFLIGITDVYVAGRMGKEIQASYGFIIQIYFIFVALGNALTVGSVSVTARLFTSGNNEGLRAAVYSSIVTASFLGLVFGVAGVLFTDYIIGLLSIPEAMKPLAIELGRIYAAGLFFQAFLINTNGILRACNRVKVSLRTMAVVCVMNVPLTVVLAFFTPLGFRGVAVATALSVLIGGTLNLRQVRPFLSRQRVFSFPVARRILGIGWPIGLVQFSWQASSMVIFLVLAMLPRNSIEMMAALTAGLRVESVIYLPAFAFNMANAVITGNLLGKESGHAASRAGIVTAVMAVVVVSAITLVVILNAVWIVPLLSRNPLVISEALRYLYISMIGEPFMAWSISLGGAMSGAGDTLGVMGVVVLATWLFRISLIYIFIVIFGFGPASVWWVMAFTHAVMALFMTRRYWKGKWLEKGRSF
jgi:MATE family multidrug resistance protein